MLVVLGVAPYRALPQPSPQVTSVAAPAAPEAVAVVPIATPAPEAEYLPLKVWVNGEERGVYLLSAQDGVPCLTAANAEALQLPRDLLPVGALEDCRPLPSLEPALRGELLGARGELRLQVDPQRLPAQRLDLGYGRATAPAEYPHSVYLNYAVDLRDGEEGATRTLLPLELGLRAGRWFARSTAQADEDGLHRQYSSLQRDFPERLAMLTAGDVNSGAGSVTGGAGLLGLQWSRNFRYEPFVQRSPGLRYGGVLDTPSTVEVYVDDRRVSTLSLPAGPFDLRNLPVQAGITGDARVEIVDAFGQRRVYELPYFLGNNLLNAGESEFSYALGLPRRFDGGAAYGDRPIGAATHRWGLTDRLTLGYQAAAGDRLGLAGAEADVVLGVRGQVSAGGFVGGDPDDPAGYWRVGYRYATARLSLDTDYSRQQAGFYGTPEARDIGRRRLWATRLGGLLGAFYGSLSYQTGAASAGGIERYGLTLGTRLPRLGTLNLQAQHDARRDDSSVLLTLSVPLRRGPSLQFGGQVRDSWRELSARLSAPPRGYTGLGYRVDASRAWERDDDGARAALRAQADWRAPAFTALVDRDQRADGPEVTRAVFAGSVSGDARALAFGQPVRGSFATVEVEGLPGAEVYADGRRIGAVDDAGRLTVTDLSPYFDHEFAVLLPGSLPIGTDLPERRQALTVAEGGGGRVAFKPRRLRLYEGYLRRRDGSAVEYAPLVLRDAAGELRVTTTSGEGGYLYLENLVPGEYQLEAAGRQPCRLTLVLPAGDTTYLDLGTLSCG